ncbi:LanC-like protein 2 [Eumeta japonica]|uniref:LanC-like protein 2 n=1 Tax=Eumeta variegata TaxID=151549 RepID=A0A4C1UW52_EUMVA|nr:LanC-like protein 2 [Eumeta japonica]
MWQSKQKHIGPLAIRAWLHVYGAALAIVHRHGAVPQQGAVDVKVCPVLWDKTNDNYKDKYVKTEGWKDIWPNVLESFDDNNIKKKLNWVSQEFLSKLEHFTETRLNILETRMEKDIYCDGTVYTGSAGLALYYLKHYFQDPNPEFLKAREYIEAAEITDYIKPTLDWLLDQQFASKNFPSSLGSTSGDRLVQWCHGAPGFVPLCLLAYEVFRDRKYLKLALKLGDVVWERGLCKKGYSICHGVSGNAYAFIQLYQTTKKPVHLYRAARFMEWCLDERKGTEHHRPDRPASLFEGVVGRVYLAQDFKDILNAQFPAFTV